ncbi:hypothetical protein N9I21_01415 [Crocinitomicaceae bacterium]|nr:hypothetical protein [Crocinitomicaceae bacterium]
MLRFIKQLSARIRKYKSVPVEYSTVISNMEVEGYGIISFAQWQHPKEEPKKITKHFEILALHEESELNVGDY